MAKKVPYIVCGAVVVVAIIAMIIFVLSGGDNPAAEPVNIEGTWKVAVYTNSGTVTIIDNEYMVFTEDNASDYRDGELFASSSYTIDNKMEMNLPDMSMSYTVEKHTENFIRLCTAEGIYTDLIRYGNADMSPLEFDSAAFDGKWNIIYRNTTASYAGAYMVFEDGTAYQYSAGASEPVSTSGFSWKDGNHLVADGWSKEMVLYPLSGDTVMMVELATDNGFIWELQRAD